jgi:hypothetical protein
MKELVVVYVGIELALALAAGLLLFATLTH